MSNSQTFILPTMFPSNNTGMDLLSGPAPDNYDKIRGRNLSTNGSISRDSLIVKIIDGGLYFISPFHVILF